MKKSLVLAAVGMLVAVWAHAAYVIVLKSGGRVVAQSKYEVRGSNAIFKLKNGTLTSLPVHQIDVAATDRLNARSLGDATPLDWIDDQTPPPTPTPTPSITTLGQIRTGVAGPEGDAALPTPTPGIMFRAASYADPKVEEVFSSSLEQVKLFFTRTGQGTRPGYLFLEVQVNGQTEVTKALQAITSLFHHLVQKEPARAPERVEILLLNEAGREAGVFRLSPADAAILATGQVTPEDFFVQHVIF